MKTTTKQKSLTGNLIDGKYRVLEKLGGGGMGVVYKGKHELMDRTVAIKMLHSHLASSDEDQDFLVRFKREAQTAAKIDHSSAVTIYDYGIHEGAPYLVMQYVSGVTLKKQLKTQGAMPLSQVIPLMIQICSAVNEAHHLNIVHRDLKPDNIVITNKSDGSERAVVLDFGIAKILGLNDAKSSVTKTGSVIGTPQYMSPEQVHGSELDGRSDLY